jgi:hypothetical protein
MRSASSGGPQCFADLVDWGFLQLIFSCWNTNNSRDLWFIGFDMLLRPPSAFFVGGFVIRYFLPFFVWQLSTGS